MTTNKRLIVRLFLIAFIIAVLTAASARQKADSEMCGGAAINLPFTDVGGNIFFCEIAEAYFSGLTNGTTPTTFSPAQNVPREQMAAFATRTLNQSLARRSRRAALNQFWTTKPLYDANLGTTVVGGNPVHVACDGADLWVTSIDSGTVSRVRASDGKLLGTWTGATGAHGVLVAMGRVFITGQNSSGGALYQIDPTVPAGPVTLLSNS